MASNSTSAWMGPQLINKLKQTEKTQHVTAPPKTSDVVEAPGDDVNVIELKNGAKLAFQSNRTLILDTAAFLHGNFKLEELGSEFYTTPAVIAEIRDSKSRHILATLPFKIVVREPQKDSISTVARYAKKTGDYGFLSATDLGVLGLTYELELERNGPVHIKPEPKKVCVFHIKFSIISWKPRIHIVKYL